MFALITAGALGLHVATAAAGGYSTGTTLHISNAAGGQDCSAIGVWNSATLTCTLTGDVTMTAAVDGIHIDSDGVTLDGNGHSLTGTGALSTYGVYLSGRTGVTIKNLNVTNFYDGIYLSNSSNNTVSGNTASSNSAFGIVPSTSSNNTILGNADGTNNFCGTITYPRAQLKIHSAPAAGSVAHLRAILRDWQA